jgi:hypothetical protein
VWTPPSVVDGGVHAFRRLPTVRRVSTVISVQLDAVEALAAELASLARCLADDARLCTSTARSLSAALGGDDGWRAGAAATAWGSLSHLLADGAGALSTTLLAAVGAYRAADAGLAGALDPGLGRRGGPR